MRSRRRSSHRSSADVAAARGRCDDDDVATKGKHTRADLAGLPSNRVGELIAGVVYASPRPASRHALAASVVVHDLLGPFHRGHGGGGPGGWWIVVEPELALGDDVLVPDVAGWRRERMPAFPDVAAFALAPDWACEIVSPSTGRLDRVVKMPVYAAAGVRHLWVVDPLARTLEVYAAHDGRWLVSSAHADGDVVRAAPFDAVAIDLTAWWGDERR
jgi:hypothetical protein